MYLITKRVTYYNTKDEVIKMYNHYLKCMRDYDYDDDYIDYLKILNDDGEVIDECKRFE